jgi:hypothetical protein
MAVCRADARLGEEEVAVVARRVAGREPVWGGEMNSSGALLASRDQARSPHNRRDLSVNLLYKVRESMSACRAQSV